MQEYVKTFLSQVQQEDPSVMVEIVESTRKSVLDFLENKIAADRESLSKLEAVTSKIKND